MAFLLRKPPFYPLITGTNEREKEEEGRKKSRDQGSED
jgi:hypothetical protein